MALALLSTSCAAPIERALPADRPDYLVEGCLRPPRGAAIRVLVSRDGFPLLAASAGGLVAWRATTLTPFSIAKLERGEVERFAARLGQSLESHEPCQGNDTVVVLGIDGTVRSSSTRCPGLREQLDSWLEVLGASRIQGASVPADNRSPQTWIGRLHTVIDDPQALRGATGPLPPSGCATPAPGTRVILDAVWSGFVRRRLVTVLDDGTVFIHDGRWISTLTPAELETLIQQVDPAKLRRAPKLECSDSVMDGASLTVWIRDGRQTFARTIYADGCTPDSASSPHLQRVQEIVEALEHRDAEPWGPTIETLWGEAP